MANMNIKLFFALLISFLITLYVVPLMMRVAHRLRILDVPDGTIKKHAHPTPYLGGVAVYIGFLVSLALVFPFQNQILLFIVGATLLLFVGLVDDLIAMQPYQKFFGQFLASLCFLKAGFFLKESFFLKNILNIPISLLWILTIINAFNLVDVMDGLATSLAISATASFLLIAYALQVYQASVLLASLLGALCAFLVFNRPRAQIYLGDAGSLFIGGLLATIPFLFPWGTYAPYGYLTPMIILFIPLVEVSTLIGVRTYKGIPFYKASPDHFCLYLRVNGWDIKEILWYISAFSVVLCCVAYAFVFSLISLFLLFCLMLSLFAFWCGILWYRRKNVPSLP